MSKRKSVSGSVAVDDQHQYEPDHNHHDHLNNNNDDHDNTNIDNNNHRMTRAMTKRQKLNADKSEQDSQHLDAQKDDDDDDVENHPQQSLPQPSHTEQQKGKQKEAKQIESEQRDEQTKPPQRTMSLTIRTSGSEPSTQLNHIDINTPLDDIAKRIYGQHANTTNTIFYYRPDRSPSSPQRIRDPTLAALRAWNPTLEAYFVGSSQIVVRTLMGKLIILDVEYTDTIGNIKAKIQDKEGVPPEQQRLLGGYPRVRDFYDHMTLAECGVNRGDELQLVLRLRGC